MESERERECESITFQGESIRIQAALGSLCLGGANPPQPPSLWRTHIPGGVGVALIGGPPAEQRHHDQVEYAYAGEVDAIDDAAHDGDQPREPVAPQPLGVFQVLRACVRVRVNV